MERRAILLILLPPRRQVPARRHPELGGILGGASIGDTLSGGLRELMDAFRQKGQGDVADSGLRAVRTSRLLLRNWNRLSALMCCKLCPSKLGCRAKRFLQGSPKICPTPWTNILPKAAFRAQRTFLEEGAK